uniref:RNA-dependent RNA polymerase n=1 Tax=Quercus lobata TaxID=97700 RepID=A0A7N2L6C7_QUELO
MAQGPNGLGREGRTSSIALWISDFKIQHHQPHGRAKKFLLIQLLGAPRIYVEDHTRHWVREVDFTPSCCIGQSSALCLEVPQKEQLPKFHEGFDLPYKILFKINSLIQHGCLPGQAINAYFYRLVDPKRISIVEYIESALDKLFNVKECCYEPVSWVEDRVLITLSKIYFCGPEVNLSNHVIRNYHEYIDDFLRVSFVDEDLDKLHATVLSSCASSAKGERRTGIYDRILSILRNGIVIGPKRRSIVEYIESVLDKLSNVKECCYEPVSWVEDQYKKYANSKRQSHHETVAISFKDMATVFINCLPRKITMLNKRVDLKQDFIRQVKAFWKTKSP